MLRSAAKGRRVVICAPADREKVVEWLKDGEPDKDNFLSTLVAKSEETVARYASLSAEYHSAGGYKNIFGKKVAELVYGENAYQTPAYHFRVHGGGADPLALMNWQQIEGAPLSYNNLCDVDRMLQTVTHIAAGFEKNFGPSASRRIALGVKHGNACGAAVAETGEEAIEKMLLGDLRAIFGGLVMLNFPIDEKMADLLVHKFTKEGQRRLLDLVAAPSFTPEAIEILARKKGKCRLLVNEAILKPTLDSAQRFRYVRGGFLLQPNYTFVPELRTVLKENSPRTVLEDSILAWAIGCTSNSNTVTLVKDGRLVGNGVGQQDRVGAAKLAIFRADDAAEFADLQKNSAALPASGLRHGQNFTADLQEATAYSDSFFPFPDAVEVLIEVGVKTIFSTSGSVNDEKIKELCKSKGVNLILLPDTEARGFYQH